MQLVVDTNVSPTEDLFGKHIGDLQENVAIGSDAITGHLNYIDDYTGFSSNPAEQTGNYLVIHASVPGASNAVITVSNDITVTLDDDGIYVGRIRDKDEQTITVVARVDGEIVAQAEYDLSGLTVDNS